MPRKLARNRLISTISIISLHIDFKQEKNVTIAGVSAELSGRGRWRGRGHLHIQGELAFFFILMRMTIQNFYSNKTSQMVHVMDIRMTIQNLFQKPAEWSMSWTMMKHSKSSDLSPAYSQVDPHSKSLVPIIVAGGKDGKILQTMIKRSN